MGVVNGYCLWMRGMKKREEEGDQLGRRPWLLFVAPALPTWIACLGWN